MKLHEAIDEADRERPNDVPEERKTKWINMIERDVIEKVINRALRDEDMEYQNLTYEENSDTELSIESPYDELYVRWLVCQIDLQNGDIQLYNNDLTVYNSLFEEYANYYRRTNMPKQSNSFSNFGG